MDNINAPPINRVKVSWRYEGETDYFNSQTYPDMYEAIKGMLKEVFPTIDFSNGCVSLANRELLECIFDKEKIKSCIWGTSNKDEYLNSLQHKLVCQKI